MNFEIGSVVRLKSGGPRLTITDLFKGGIAGTDDWAKVSWFEGTPAESKTSSFPVSALIEGGSGVASATIPRPKRPWEEVM